MSSRINSALWMLFASLNFALLNTLVKFLSEDFSLSQIIFFRSFFAIIFILPWLSNAGLSSLKTNSIKLQICRSSVALAAMYLWFFSISKIPLAEATAINFTAPIFGAICAIIFLGEKIKKRRFIAILLSIIGALIIIKPGFNNLSYYLLIAVFASLLMGFAAIFIKKLSMVDHPNAVVFYMPAILAIFSILPCICFWKTPSFFEGVLLISTGLTATLAHQGITRAFAKSEATYVLIFDYLRLPFTALLAFYIFFETPSISLFLGSLIIFISSIYIINREKVAGKKETTPVITAKRL
jgi:drug/metabolite transporter (DMT)-like permease